MSTGNRNNNTNPNTGQSNFNTGGYGDKFQNPNQSPVYNNYQDYYVDDYGNPVDAYGNPVYWDDRLNRWLTAEEWYRLYPEDSSQQNTWDNQPQNWGHNTQENNTGFEGLGAGFEGLGAGFEGLGAGFEGLGAGFESNTTQRRNRNSIKVPKKLLAIGTILCLVAALVFTILYFVNKNDTRWDGTITLSNPNLEISGLTMSQLDGMEFGVTEGKKKANLEETAWALNSNDIYYGSTYYLDATALDWGTNTLVVANGDYDYTYSISLERNLTTSDEMHLTYSSFDTKDPIRYVTAPEYSELSADNLISLGYSREKGSLYLTKFRTESGLLELLAEDVPTKSNITENTTFNNILAQNGSVTVYIDPDDNIDSAKLTMEVNLISIAEPRLYCYTSDGYTEIANPTFTNNQCYAMIDTSGVYFVSGYKLEELEALVPQLNIMIIDMSNFSDGTEGVFSREQERVITNSNFSYKEYGGIVSQLAKKSFERTKDSSIITNIYGYTGSNISISEGISVNDVSANDMKNVISYDTSKTSSKAITNITNNYFNRISSTTIFIVDASGAPQSQLKSVLRSISNEMVRANENGVYYRVVIVDPDVKGLWELTSIPETDVYEVEELYDVTSLTTNLTNSFGTSSNSISIVYDSNPITVISVANGRVDKSVHKPSEILTWYTETNQTNSYGLALLEKMISEVAIDELWFDGGFAGISEYIPSALSTTVSGLAINPTIEKTLESGVIKNSDTDLSHIEKILDTSQYVKYKENLIPASGFSVITEKDLIDNLTIKMLTGKSIMAQIETQCGVSTVLINGIYYSLTEDEYYLKYLTNIGIEEEGYIKIKPYRVACESGINIAYNISGKFCGYDISELWLYGVIEYIDGSEVKYRDSILNDEADSIDTTIPEFNSGELEAPVDIESESTENGETTETGETEENNTPSTES